MRRRLPKDVANRVPEAPSRVSTHQRLAEVSSLNIDTQLTSGPDAPRQARALMARFREWLEPSAYETARLLMSEAVTNAVVHGRAGEPVRISATVDHERFRVELCNRSGQTRPQVVSREPGLGGLGLQLMDALAREWGTEHNDHTLVWFEVAVSPPVATAEGAS
jgi:serine/threonine-protein kinase RsbW